AQACVNQFTLIAGRSSAGPTLATHCNLSNRSPDHTFAFGEVLSRGALTFYAEPSGMQGSRRSSCHFRLGRPPHSWTGLVLHRRGLLSSSRLTCSAQASAEHLEQCAELLLLRNPIPGVVNSDHVAWLRRRPNPSGGLSATAERPSRPRDLANTLSRKCCDPTQRPRPRALPDVSILEGSG